MSIKQAFLKSNESSLNKKSDVVEIDVASNHINDTHGYMKFLSLARFKTEKHVSVALICMLWRKEFRM